MNSASYGLGSFSAWFVDLVGFSPWWVTLVVVAACVLYRIDVVLSQDKREARRRKLLVEDLRGFLDVAMGANREHLANLEHLRLLAHARAFLARISIDEAATLHGIGRQTIASLKQEGFVTLRDVLTRNILTVRGIGFMRASQILAYAKQRLDAVLLEVEQRGSADALAFPRDPKVDEEFDAHRREILQRQTQLGVDVGALVAHDAEIDALVAAARSRSTSERLAAYRAELLETLRSPARWLGHVGGIAVGLALLGAVPLAAAAWSPDALATGATVSAALVWLALHTGVISWFVLADKPFAPSTRPLNPHNFVEQRLQLRVLSMAHELGLAPPCVVVSPGPRDLAHTIGRAQGPGVVVVGELLLHFLDTDALEAVIGHELGHLKEDHIRQGVAISMVLSPIIWLQRQILGLALHAGIRVRNRIHAVEGGLVAEPDIRVASLFWLLLFLPLGAVALVLSCLTLGLSGITGLFSRLHEFRADEIGKRLSGGGDAMARALDGVDRLVALMSQARSQAPQVARMPGEAARAFAAPLALRAQHVYLRAEARLTMTHPTTDARVEALEGDVPLMRDTLRAVASVAFVVALGAATLWYGVSGARGLAEGMSRVELASLLPMPAPAAVVAPAPEAWTPTRAMSGSKGHVRFKVRRCHLRAEGNKHARHVTVMSRGDVCERRGSDLNDWAPLRCGKDIGWAHSSCLTSLP